MKTKFLCMAALSFAAFPRFAAAQTAPQAGNEKAQQLTVLRTNHLVAGTQELTNTEANCSIAGTGGAATMQCLPASGNTKSLYNYNTALVVDSDGTAYVIACRIPLIAVSCKKLDVGSVVEGRFDKELLSITDGDKARRYQVLTSANIGQLPRTSPPPSKSAAPARSGSAPTSVVAAAQPSNAPGNKKAENQQAALPSDSSGGCTPSAGACVTFVSEPPGADIYVNGKFVGNTPSMIVLAAGSHQLRIEADHFAAWERPVEASAGSRVTIRAALQPRAP